jgi:trafficking kinesin-binding protein 1
LILLQLTLENEELVMQLRVVRECQNELATELVDYKDKYAEILELLRETQEQLKQQNKRNLPTARSGFTANHYSSTPSYNSPRLSGFHPDSLASELEMSSLGSDGWMSDFSSCLVPPK